MAAWVAEFVTWLEALPPAGIYAVLLGIAYGENLVPPLWGDTVIVLCGSLVGLGVLSFWPAVALASLGGAAGFLTVFAAGRRLGEAIHDPARMRWIPRGALGRVERWLSRWGYGVVAANRFLAGGRAVIGLLAGASDLRWAPTAAWATVSAVAWSLLLVWGGARLGAEWERVLDWLANYGRVVTVALGAALAVAAVRRWRARPKNSRRRDGAEAPDPPPVG
ncbi:DedA family protein [Rubrivirga sp.]|uniref:DedA family protein n=1 Tax=Rubrivirga sp. TaxID=1885344 RepID=UPI003B52FA20